MSRLYGQETFTLRHPLFFDVRAEIKKQMFLRGETFATLASKYGMATNHVRDCFNGNKCSRDVFKNFERDFKVEIFKRLPLLKHLKQQEKISAEVAEKMLREEQINKISSLIKLKRKE